MIEIEINRDVFLDCFHHILDDDDVDIELIWGGRDSGKSQFVAQLYTLLSLELDYFRGVLFKQTGESIQDAQWQMIKDVCEEWGVDHLFEFNSSPLKIQNEKGATFLARGMDKPGKIRSITNPSHGWIEEANQLSESGFVNILTGLRNKHGRVKLILTFNPESTETSYEDFWLYKWFFKDHFPNELSFTDSITTVIQNELGQDETIKLTYRSTHVTYHKNPFVSSQRRAFHESLKTSNYYWYQVFTLGLWGNQRNDMPWAFAFDRHKHVGRPVADRAYDLYLSFDFNRNPMCCNLFQFDGRTVRGIKSYKLPNMGVEGVCNRILVDFPGFLYIVTGDYSGDTATTLYEEQVSNYTVIKRMMNLSDAQIQIQPNPRLVKNRTVVNLALQQIPHEFHEEDQKPLIWDMENVRANGDGTIDKGAGSAGRKDPTKQADNLDTYRYFANLVLKPIIDIPDV